MPLIISEKGAGLFFQGTKFPGKLFVASFGLDREHTSWPIDQTFIPFLDLALQTARAEDPTPTTFEPGEISKIQLPAGSAVREAVVRDERRERLDSANRRFLPVTDETIRRHLAGPDDAGREFTSIQQAVQGIVALLEKKPVAK